MLVPKCASHGQFPAPGAPFFDTMPPKGDLQMGKRRGKIVVEFGSAEDLDRIVWEIVGSAPTAAEA